MRRFLLLSIIAAAFSASTAAPADRFERVKLALKNAECVRIEFLSVLHSSIFRQTDTSQGVAVISRDGRYRVAVGKEQFLNDSRMLYSYSEENNQVLMQKVDSNTSFSKEVSYITGLDEFYTTRTLRSGVEYQLTRKKGAAQSLPDSLHVVLDGTLDQIASLEYPDVNGELVSIVILKQLLTSSCNEPVFTPDFPDSAERVKL